MGGGGEDKTYHPLASTLPPTNPFRLRQGEGDALWKMRKEGKSEDGKRGSESKKVLIARWSLSSFRNLLCSSAGYESKKLLTHAILQRALKY